MVQILDRVPTFGERLAPALNQIGQSIAERRNATAWQKLISPEQTQPSNPNQTGVDQMQQIGQQGQTNQSPLDRMFNKPGGPSIAELQNAYDTAEKYKQGSGKVVLEYGLNKQKAADKEASSMRLENQKRQSDIAKKSTEADIGKRENIQNQRRDIKLALDAVRSGDVSGFDLNYLGGLFGKAGEPLKNSKGVQLESATKNLLVEGLQKVSGRPNLWIDQMMFGALGGVGKSTEANETLFTIANTKLDVEEALLDAKDNIRSQYEQNGLPPPSNLDQMAHQQIKEYAFQAEDKLAYDLRVIYEKEKGEKSLKSLQKVPQGTPLTLEKRDALLKKFGGDKEKAKKIALQLGYTIPSANIMKNYLEPQEGNVQ